MLFLFELLLTKSPAPGCGITHALGRLTALFDLLIMAGVFSVQFQGRRIAQPPGKRYNNFIYLKPSRVLQCRACKTRTELVPSSICSVDRAHWGQAYQTEKDDCSSPLCCGGCLKNHLQNSRASNEHPSPCYFHKL